MNDIRIVLLGPRYAGKSSVGNIILGTEEFDTKSSLQCMDKHSHVAGRKLTVVDTPGWWGHLPLKDNPELYKQELVLSVTRCPPGPHVLLLVLNMNTPFKEREKKSVDENLNLLGENVWDHTMVLFTYEDTCFKDVNIEQYIKSEGDALQWLVEKCGNRYHVLHNKKRGDGAHVTELLEKIEKMLTANRRHYYELDREILKSTEEKKRAEQKRAEERRMKNQKQTEELKSLLETKTKYLPDMRIMLVGYNGAGKSSSANTILAKPAFDLKRSITSVIREGDVSGRHITVVDTPGRRRNYSKKYTPRFYKDEVVLSPSLCPPGPHVFLLVIRVNVSFTDVYRRAVEEHVLTNLGPNIWNHIIILFTFGDWLGDRSIEQFIESEGEPLQFILEKCGNRYHVFNNMNKDDINQVTELLKKIEEMVAGNRGCCYEINQKKIQEVKERRMLAEEKETKMKDKVQKCRNELRHSVSGVPELSEIRLVLCGFSGTDKTSAGNTILGRRAFDTERSEKNLKEKGEVAGKKLTVVATPSFKRDLEAHKHNVIRAVRKCFPGPHAFLLVLSTDCSFTEDNKITVEKLMEPLGESVWHHTMILFTDRDQLGDTPIELFIASESDALMSLTEKCGNRYHVLNIKNWSHETQVTELLEKIEEMVSGNKKCHYEMNEDTQSMNSPIQFRSSESSAYFSQTSQASDQHLFSKTLDEEMSSWGRCSASVSDGEPHSD